MADKTDTIKTRLAFDGEAEYKAACKELNSNLQLLGSEMKVVTAEYKNNADSVEALKAKQAVLTRTYDEQAKKIAETEKAIESARNGTIKNEEAARRLEISLNNQKAALANTKNALDEVADELDASAKNVDDFGDEVEESGKKAEEAGGKFEGLKNIGEGLTRAFAGLAAGTAAVGGALAAGFGYAVNAADEAKGAMNDFMAATGEATEKTEEYEQVMENIYNANYGEGFEDISKAMQEVKQQAGNIGTKELEKMTKNALMLRDTFEFEVNESVRASEMLMQQFGLSSEEAYNLIAQGAQSGLNKNGDLMDVINEYSVHYAQAGLSAEEMFNSLANGTKAGTFSVDKLGDAMKEFQIRVKDGSDTSAAAFEYLGYDADALFKTFSEGGEDAAAMTQILIDELASMPDGVEKTTAGVALFGTMWEDLGAEGIKALSQIEGEISLTTDALAQINEVKYDTFGEAMGGVGRILQTSFIMPIGDEALPLFTDFANSLADGAKSANGDISALAGTFGTAVGELVTGIAEMIPQFTTMATELVLGLTNGLVSCAPQIMTAGVELITNLVAGIVQAIPEIANSAVQIMTTLVQGIIDLLPSLIEGAVQLVVTLAQGIAAALPELVPQLVELMLFVVDTLVENLPVLINAALEIIVALANGLIESLPMLTECLPEIIIAIINGLIEALPTIIEAAGEIIVALATGLVEALPVLIDALPEIVIAIVEGLAEALPKVVKLMGELLVKVAEVLKDLPGKVWDSIKNAVTKMSEWGGQMKEKAKTAMSELINDKVIPTLKELPGKIWDAIIKCVDKIADWGVKMKDKAKDAISTVCTNIKDGFKELPGNLLDVGTNLVEGLWNGISNAKDWVLDKIKGFGDDVLDGIKSFFGINSPSRVMRDEVGVFMAQGIGVGFTDEMEKVSRDINNSIPREFDVQSKVNIDAEADIDGTPTRTRGGSTGAGGVTVIQHIYAKDTSYKAQQKEAAKQFQNIAREVVA